MGTHPRAQTPDLALLTTKLHIAPIRPELVPRPRLIERLNTGLGNEIAALPGRLVLVLDDYHVISNREIQEGLTFLLDHQPPTLHLVLSTRADPPYPFSGCALAVN